MSLFFIISIFIAFRINGIKKDRLNNFRCGLRRMSSNSLVYHIYQNEGDLRHTFEHCRSSLTCNASYENLLDNLSERLHVDKVILDYNLYCLHHIIHVFQSKYRSYERSNLLFDHHFQLPVHEQHMRMLNQNELIILLEFFLQIDVDLFFMKT